MTVKSSASNSALITAASMLALLLNFHSVHAFVRNYRSPTMPLTVASSFGNVRTVPTMLWYADSPDTASEIDASELRKQFGAYGISTEEFEETATRQSETEKGEIRDAGSVDTASESTTKENWEKVRESLSSKWEHVASVAREMLSNHARGSSSDQFSDTSSTESRLSDGQGSEVSPSSSSSSSHTMRNARQERYDSALVEGRSMSRSSLKQELEGRGIYTGSFFDKSDMVKAYANVVADEGENEEWEAQHTASTTRHSKQEEFDPSYRSVTMHSFDPRTLSRGDIIIDITK